MNEDFENIEESAKHLATRFDEMLKNGTQYYFDVFEFENIIDFYISKREYRKAQIVVEYALNLHKNAFSIITKQAQILIKLSQPIKALRLLKKLLKLENSDSNLHFLKGVVYCTLGNIRNAKHSFNKSLSLDLEAKVDLLFNISIAFQEIGRYDFSIDYLLQAYKIDNKDIAVMYDLAYCYEKLDNNDLSISFYKKYISENPFSEIVWYNIALIYEKTEKYNSAIDAFEYAIAIDSEYGMAYFHKGKCLFEIDQYEECIEIFKEFIKISPNDSYSMLYIGESYYNLSEYNDAIKYFDKAFNIDNDLHEALYLKTLALLELEDFYEADDLINQAIKLDEKNSGYWLLSAVIYNVLELAEQAEEALKKTIDLDPEIPSAWIEYSKLDFGEDDTERKISILSEAFENIDNDAEINYRLAAYYAKNNQIDKATLHLKLALYENISEISIFYEIYEEKNETLENIIAQYKENTKDNNEK